MSRIMGIKLGLKRQAEANTCSDSDGSNIMRVMEVPLSQLLPNTAQPRKKFDDEAIISLSESIKTYGVIQPLTVRKTYGSDRYEIVAGERRYRASILAGLRCVPCIIIDADSETSAALSIIENIQREDLNIFEEAEAISKLISIYELTQEQIAARLSVSQSYVANKLRLLRLGPDERALILQNSITERHARTLLRLHDKKVRYDALCHIIKNNMNVRAAESYVDSILAEEKATQRQKQKQKVKFVIKDLKMFYNSIDRAAALVRGAGIPVDIKKRETDREIEMIIRIRTPERAV